MRRTPLASSLVCASLASLSGQVQPAGPSRPAVRLDAVPAIVAVFRTHALVAFPGPFDPLLPALFADTEFAATVNDLVVEFGNARYQDVMDRFQRGESVSDAELRRVWLDTTDPPAL